MGETLDKEVEENVFSAEALLFACFDAVKNSKNIIFRGFDSKGSAEESVALVREGIRELFGKEYKCYAEPDGEDHKLNCVFIR